MTNLTNRIQKIFDKLNLNNPSLIKPGDKVSFYKITKEEYSMFPKTKSINWRSVREEDDNTIGSQELACTGDKCEIL